MTEKTQPEGIFNKEWTLDTADPELGTKSLTAPEETTATNTPIVSQPPVEPKPEKTNRSIIPPEPVTPPPLLRILEAMLFVGGLPLSEARACETVRGLTPEQLKILVEELNAQYRAQQRPYHIKMQDQGYLLTVKTRYKIVEDRMNGNTREARLSQAAVDTLALVAYRQPVGKQEIDTVRGAESGSLLRQLVRRGLISVQRPQGDQKEVMYNTTRRFLELFQLRSLDELPQTQDLQRI